MNQQARTFPEKHLRARTDGQRRVRTDDDVLLDEHAAGPDRAWRSTGSESSRTRSGWSVSERSGVQAPMRRRRTSPAGCARPGPPRPARGPGQSDSIVHGVSRHHNRGSTT